jgi:hypothetical protein
MAEHDFRALHAALGRKVADLGCPACQMQGLWGSGTAVLALPVGDTQTDNGKRLEKPDSHVQMLPVSCEHCGYTQFFEVERLLNG